MLGVPFGERLFFGFLIMLPTGFEPTDEWARNNYGIGLADYYKRNPGVQSAYENSPAKLAEKARADAAAAEAKQQALALKQKQETDARFAQGKTDVNDFVARYGAAVPQIINDTSNKYGLNNLLGQANSLNTRVRTLQGNLDNNGAGGYANANQVDAAINSRYLPAAQTAVTNLNTATGLAQAEESALLKPYETEGTLLNERLARESTGYSQEQQRELDGLIAMIQNGTALSKAQMDQAVQLAQIESDYKKALEVAKIGAAKPTEQNRYITLGDGAMLFDTQTGQIVSQNQKNFAGKAGESFS